jgi:hypothetical protein
MRAQSGSARSQLCCGFRCARTGARAACLDGPLARGNVDLMAIRLGGVEVNRRAAWVVPVVSGVAVVAYLSWRAWVSAHDPQWPDRGQVWWRAWLQPGNDRARLVAIASWLMALLCYCWAAPASAAAGGDGHGRLHGADRRGGGPGGPVISSAAAPGTAV